MALPSWSELSPLTRRSKRKRYELIREELNALADVQEDPESPEPQEEPEDDDEENGEEGDNEEE